MLGYGCRWLGYVLYLGYYYSVHVIRRMLLLVLSGHVVEMIFFAIYYVYRVLNYYINPTLYIII